MDLHHRKSLLVFLLHPLSTQLDDPQIFYTHPDAAVEQMFLTAWFHVKDKKVRIVNLFFTSVAELVFGYRGRLKYELVRWRYIVQVFFGDRDVPQRRLWK